MAANGIVCGLAGRRLRSLLILLMPFWIIVLRRRSVRVEEEEVLGGGFGERSDGGRRFGEEVWMFEVGFVNFVRAQCRGWYCCNSCLSCASLTLADSIF